MESFLPSVLGSVMNMVVLFAFLACIAKVFQIATTLNEIKDAIKDIQRNQHALPVSPKPAPGIAFGQSGDEMLRSLDAELHLSADAESIKPEIISPR